MKRATILGEKRKKGKLEEKRKNPHMKKKENNKNAIF